MTKEALEERLAELEARIESLSRDVVANDGARQECLYWLSRLTEEQP